MAGGECPPEEDLSATTVGVQAAGYLPISGVDCVPSGLCDLYDGMHCIPDEDLGHNYIAYVLTDAQAWEAFYQYCDSQYEPVVDWETEHLVVFVYEGGGCGFELPTAFRTSEHEDGRPHIDTFVWGINELSDTATDCWGVGGDALVVSFDQRSTVCLKLGEPCY